MTMSNSVSMLWINTSFLLMMLHKPNLNVLINLFWSYTALDIPASFLNPTLFCLL